MAFAPVDQHQVDLLRVLWERGPSPVRVIADRLYPGGRASDHATVQKLLERLEAKSCVSRERQEGRHNVFEALVGREELVARRLRQTAEQLCDGSLAPLLTHLVSAGELSPEELRDLQKLVDRLSVGG